MDTRPVVRAIVYDIKKGEPQYLLLKTKKGYWQNPQGGIDKKESKIEAMIREVEEETSLNPIKIIKDANFETEYDTKRKGKQIHTILFSYAMLVDSNNDVKLSPVDGHTDFIWAPYDKVLSLLTTYPEQKKVFEEVTKKIPTQNYNSSI